MIGAVPVAPDFTAVQGTGLYAVVGALLTVALIAAVAMLIVCAVWWAIALHTANWHQASRARVGVLVAAGAAALSGAILAYAHWLIDVGGQL